MADSAAATSTSEKQNTRNYLDVKHTAPVAIGAKLTPEAYDYLTAQLAQKYADRVGDENGRKYLMKGPIGDWLSELLVPAVTQLGFTGDVVPISTKAVGAAKSKAFNEGVAYKRQELSDKLAAMAEKLDPERFQELMALING